jgi:hypothetical protein
MRFMMLMIPKGYEKAEPGTMPDPKNVEKMMKYNEALKSAGVLLSAEGLHPPSEGARISFRQGQPVVSQGPFPEAKEVLGGFWMIEVKSKDEAIAWASRCPAAENETIEIRQVQEFEEFPEDIQKVVGEFDKLYATPVDVDGSIKGLPEKDWKRQQKESETKGPMKESFSLDK